MNNVESYITLSPFGKEDECAKFTIDEVFNPFTLHDTMNIGHQYVYSAWMRSDANGAIIMNNSLYEVGTEWSKIDIKFKATMDDLKIYFNKIGTYYIYHSQLEIGNKTSDWTEAPEDVEQQIADTDSDLRQVIRDNHTTIIKDCEQIIFGALESYIETNDFEAFKQVTESQLKVLSDEIKLQFTQTTTRLTEVNNVLQEQINNITKYFTFDINGLTIGQRDNPYKVIIDNDRYSMTVNDVEVMWIADGKVYTPEIEVTRAFKLFGYLIDQDQNGNVNCAYIGGES